MAGYIIDPDSALRVVLEHLAFSGTKIEAHPLTTYLAPEYQAFQTKWFDVNTKEIVLAIDILRGVAKISFIDDALDIFVDKLSNAILLITNNDTKAELYVLFFKGKTPSEIRRPILGKQLAQMRDWIPLLKSSPHASLNELGAELELLVKQADDAGKALAAAKTANRQFRTVGERRALFDEFNAMQKRNSGKIAEIPHTDAGKNLPNTFAEAFFKKGPRSVSEEEGQKDWTSDDYLTAIAESDARTEELKARHAELLEAEKAAAAKKATLEGKKAARDEKLAAYKKAKEELEAAEKDLEDPDK